MAITDKEILEAIINGNNAKALNQLYERALLKVRAHLLKNKGCVEDANDIFQDAVIVLFDYVKAGKFDLNSSVDGFVFRVAKNLWIDKLRRKKIMEINTDEVIEPVSGFHESGLGILLDKEKSTTLAQVFKKLGDACQQLLSMQLYEKLSMKEISIKLGYENENVAKSKNYKCKKQLAALIKTNTEVLQVLQP